MVGMCGRAARGAGACHGGGLAGQPLGTCAAAGVGPGGNAAGGTGMLSVGSLAGAPVGRACAPAGRPVRSFRFGTSQMSGVSSNWTVRAAKGGTEQSPHSSVALPRTRLELETQANRMRHTPVGQMFKQGGDLVTGAEWRQDNGKLIFGTGTGPRPRPEPRGSRLDPIDG